MKAPDRAQSNSRWADYDPERSPFPPPSPLPYQTFPELFAALAAEQATKCFCTERDPDDGSRALYSWAEAHDETLRVAGFLAQRLAVFPGERVLLAAGHSRKALLVDLAIQQLGAVPVLLDTESSSELAAAVLAAERPKVIISEGGAFLSEVQAHAAGTGTLAVLALENEAPSGAAGPITFYRWEEPLEHPPHGGAAPPPASGSGHNFSAIYYAPAAQSIAETRTQLMAQIEAVIHADLIGSGEHLLAALPLPSAAGRLFMLTALALGGSLLFTTRDAASTMPSASGIAELFSDLRNAHPQIFLGRAETIDRLCAAFVNQAEQNPTTGRLTTWALAFSDEAPEKGLNYRARCAIAGHVRRKLRRSLFGTRLAACLAASPPLISQRTRDICTRLGVPLFSGYLSPANGAAISWNTPTHHDPSTLGRAFQGITIDPTRRQASGSSLPGSPHPLEEGAQLTAGGFLRLR